MAVDVLVVGAGLSGLVTAFHVKQAGHTVAMLEAAARSGGVIGSQRHAGALFEQGPNSGLDTTPLIGSMLAELGIAGERIDGSKESSRRYVVRNGTLTALPTSPAAFLSSPLFSPAAKLRLLAEPFIAKAPANLEESIAQFVIRRLGTEFLDYAIEPFVAGIYAGDPTQLSVPAAFPRLHALEQRYGSLIKGAVLGARERKKSADKGKNLAGSFSFREGMQTLTDALARAVGGIECNVTVSSVERAHDGGFVIVGDRAGESVVRTARSVVIATPAYAAATVVRSIAPSASSVLQDIVYPPVTVVASAYRRSDVGHPLNGFGFLAPAKERASVLGSLFSSTMFERRAPVDEVVLTTFVGGLRSPALAAADDVTLENSVHRELCRLVGARATPRQTLVTRWARAIPQYSLGHLRRMEAIEHAETATPGIFFCANYRGGVSIGDCVKSGYSMAKRVSLHLQTPPL